MGEFHHGSAETAAQFTPYEQGMVLPTNAYVFVITPEDLKNPENREQLIERLSKLQASIPDGFNFARKIRQMQEQIMQPGGAEKLLEEQFSKGTHFQKSYSMDSDLAFVWIDPKNFSDPRANAALISGLPAASFGDIPGNEQDWVGLVYKHELGHLNSVRQSTAVHLIAEAESDAASLHGAFSKAAGNPDAARAMLAMRAIGSITGAPTAFQVSDPQKTSALEHSTNALVDDRGHILKLDPNNALRSLVDIKTTAAAFAESYTSGFRDYDKFSNLFKAEDKAWLMEAGAKAMDHSPALTYATLKAMNDLGLIKDKAGQIYVREYLAAIEKYAPSIAQDPHNKEVYDTAMKELPKVHADVAGLSQKLDFSAPVAGAQTFGVTPAKTSAGAP